MKWTWTVLLALSALLGPEAIVAQIDAPLQIDALETLRRDGEGVPFLVVGLGAVTPNGSAGPETAPPSPDDIQWITVLGSEGWSHWGLASIERRCEFLCSIEQGDDCHWVALYQPSGVDSDVGTPFATLPGRLDLDDFVVFDREAGGPPGRDPLAALERSAEAHALLWERGGPSATRYQVAEWNPTGDALLMLAMYSNQAPDSLRSRNCSSRSREWLLEVQCSELAVLASGGLPLLLSLADYNAPKVETLARFDWGGSRHYVIRLGEKAQDVIGLVSAEPAGWTARFQPRNWSLIC